MLLENLKLDHESKTLTGAFGLDDKIDKLCREKILFAHVSNYYIAKEFYADHSDEVPKNLSTHTGHLEKALSLCETEKEKLYLLFIFKNEDDHIIEGLSAYKTLEEEENPEKKKKLKMLLELAEIKKMMVDEDEFERVVTPKDLFKRFDIVKDHMYSFDDYYNAMKDAFQK